MAKATLPRLDHECEDWNKIRQGHDDFMPKSDGAPIAVRCLKLPAKKHLLAATTAIDGSKVNKNNAAAVELFHRYAGAEVPEACTDVMAPKGRKKKINKIKMNKADTIATFTLVFESVEDAVGYKEFWIEENPGESFDDRCRELNKEAKKYFEWKNKTTSKKRKSRTKQRTENLLGNLLSGQKTVVAEDGSTIDDGASNDISIDLDNDDQKLPKVRRALDRATGAKTDRSNVTDGTNEPASLKDEHNQEMNLLVKDSTKPAAAKGEETTELPATVEVEVHRGLDQGRRPDAHDQFPLQNEHQYNTHGTAQTWGSHQHGTETRGVNPGAWQGAHGAPNMSDNNQHRMRMPLEDSRPPRMTQDFGGRPDGASGTPANFARPPNGGVYSTSNGGHNDNTYGTAPYSNGRDVPRGNFDDYDQRRNSSYNQSQNGNGYVYPPNNQDYGPPPTFGSPAPAADYHRRPDPNDYSGGSYSSQARRPYPYETPPPQANGDPPVPRPYARAPPRYDESYGPPPPYHPHRRG